MSIIRNLRNKRYLLAFPAFVLLIGILLPLPDPLFDHPYATVVESREGQLLAAKIASDEQWRFPPLGFIAR